VRGARRGVLAGAVATALVLATGALAAPTPAKLVLRLNDLPTGFKVEPAETGVRTNATVAKAAKTTVATLKKMGRLTGYEATFSRVPTEAPDELAGVSRVQSFVAAYKTAAGAKAGFARNRKTCAKATKLPLTMRIGDQAAFCRARQSFQGVEYVVYALVWRSGARTGSLVVVGTSLPLVPPSVPVRLAQTQDARMRTAR